MQNVEFANLAQIPNFYIQDLYQSIFLTSIYPQIIQERIKAQQRVNYLVF